MKPEAALVNDSSPPSKKAKTADFSSLIKRSDSITLSEMHSEELKEKVINDRYVLNNFLY